MTAYLLDTDTCSYIVKRRPIGILQRLSEAVAAGDTIGISVITYAELKQGLEASVNRARFEVTVQAFLERLHGIHDWDRAAADRWAVLYTALKRGGTPIGPRDAMIAAHALSLDAVVVTNNTRHFRRVAGLQVENWAAEA